MARDEEQSLGLLEKDKVVETDDAFSHPRTAFADYFRPSRWLGGSGESKPLRKTAWLDGLRGFAALLVYSLHHQVWGHSGIHGEFILENVFGWDRQYYFVCLPGVRILFSGGHLAVAIFYLISGYVLTLAPLSLLQSTDSGRVADNMASALFRRWIRLFLPVLVTTFVWMTLWHLLGIRNNNPIAAPPERTWLDEVWKWYCDFKNYSFIFNDSIFNAYNDHAWSLPLEFRGSILVWTVLLGLSRCRTNMRLILEASLIFYFLYIVDGWYCAAFMTGMLLCDLDLLAEKNQLPEFLERFQNVKTWVYYVLFAIAMYLGGVPSISNDIGHLRQSPGWSLLSYFKPQAFWDFRWFFRYWAATLFMIAIPRIGWLKGFFETAFCQFLGRISYSLYLVHGPILWSVGDRIYAAVGRIHDRQIATIPGWMNIMPLPSWGPFGFELNYLIPHLILLPLTFWVAEIVTKLVDEPSLKLSRWLFNYTLATKPSRT